MISEYIAYQHVICVQLFAVLVEMVDLYTKLARDSPYFTCSTSTCVLGREKGEKSRHTLYRNKVSRRITWGEGVSVGRKVWNGYGKKLGSKVMCQKRRTGHLVRGSGNVSVGEDGRKREGERLRKMGM